jgi:hypothetical protein
MKTMRRTASYGLLALILSTPMVAQAQQAQTAEGAQKFLAAWVKKGAAQTWFVDAQGRTNYVRGTATTTTTRIELLGPEESKSVKAVEKQLTPFLVTEIDSERPDGKKDACLTRIAKWEVRDQLLETRSWNTVDEGILVDTPILNSETSSYEPAPELIAFHWIDWRNVKLNRSTNGAQVTASYKEKNFIANLAFMPGEPELADRIEYAMKFLKMSCDDTAATGF